MTRNIKHNIYYLIKGKIYTCSGRRKTMLPKTMTFPDSSNDLANSTPWLSFSQLSIQKRTNSLYEIEFFWVSLSFNFNFSICDSLNSFLASSTVKPYNEPPVVSIAVSVFGSWSDGARPSSRRRSPAMLIFLSFSLIFSPTGAQRKCGKLKADWLMARRWRILWKKPLSVNSGEVMYSRWEFVLTAFGGTRVWAEGECSRVTAGDNTL